ncbi:MotA/TolQ/ExbB proton channel family protein [Nevskia soli]|uniref:MotA/TolQ/ExbB proton channel family protein n=1 Tax=Nevskia soli TaxID=418856 RepID=UPI00055D8A41|nr:MotA/TolQ/ExbB proton channel family protein [Nevskia soli]
MSLRARFKSLSAGLLLAWSAVLPGLVLVAPAAQAQTAEAPAAPAADAGIAKIANPYGLDALWKGGDAIARGVLVIMLIMSASTWYIMVVKIIDQQKVMAQAKLANSRFWSARSLQEGKAALKEGTPFWYIADRGMTANQHHEGTLVEQIDLSTWITMSVGRAVEEIQSRLQNGLAVLATVGSTAPFVGLFGTVWGIYHALTAIGISGQASIDKVAGPVGEALIMTAIGLAVAVPAVMGYNLVVRRNKAAMEKVRAFSSDLHSVLLSGGRVEAQMKQAA